MTRRHPDGTLELRIKRFHPDKPGWEERDEMIRFPLVRKDADTLWFHGLTIRRSGDDALDLWLAISGNEAAFRYRRAGAPPRDG